MKFIEIRKFTPQDAPVRVKVCDTFISKLQGLMFSKGLEHDRGVILVENNESRMNTAIHMLFMNFDLTILWLDKNMVIVDKVLAKKWAPIYLPKKPAQYVIELHPAKFPEYTIGEKLQFFDHS